MDTRGNGCPFHRVHFVLLADAIQAAFPSFSYVKCFLLSQLVAILAAFEAIRRWAAQAVRRVRAGDGGLDPLRAA